MDEKRWKGLALILIGAFVLFGVGALGLPDVLRVIPQVVVVVGAIYFIRGG